MEVQRLQSLVSKLRKRTAKAQREAGSSVVVGYNAPYAVYVHEDLTVKHVRGGMAKFLEYAAVETQEELGRLARAALRRGTTVARALLVAGQRLQQESVIRTPHLSGALKASAFTRLDGPEA